MKAQLFLTILKGTDAMNSVPIIAVSDPQVVADCVRQISRSMREGDRKRQRKVPAAVMVQ